MNTITIDSTLYEEATRFYRDTLEYQQALEYMGSFVADDLTTSVPAEDKGIDALVKQKYL